MRIVNTSALMVFVGLIIYAQNPAGSAGFESRCSRCHGSDANGGDMGPPVLSRLAALDDKQLTTLIRDGLPGRGMPPNPASPREMEDLIGHLRTLQRETQILIRRKLETDTGKTLEGVVIGEGLADLQLRTDDQRIHLLRRHGNRFREVTSNSDWATYNGDPRGNRFTKLTQINKRTVSRLSPKWMFTVPDAGTLQGTPVVVNGLMYIGPARMLRA